MAARLRIVPEVPEKPFFVPMTTRGKSSKFAKGSPEVRNLVEVPDLAAIEAELERRRSAPAVALGRALVERAGVADVRDLVGRRLEASTIHDDMRFGFPILPWDGWILLNHLAREALVRNKDGSIPARWIKALEGRFVRLASWMDRGVSLEGRLDPALALLQDLGLLAVRRGAARDTPNLAISPHGEAALKGGRVAFFRSTLEWSELAVLDPARDHIGTRSAQRVETQQWVLALADRSTKGLGARLARRILEVLPPTGAARIRDMDVAFAPADPYNPGREVPWAKRRIEVGPDTFLDRVPRDVAQGLLMDAMTIATCLGLVAVGINAEGHLTWSLAPAGRVWLGLPPDPAPQPSRHLKVTSAYDLYFARIDPQALAEISLYATPTGQEHGIVARLDRTGVQAARAIGISVPEIVASLEGLAASPLPANVRTTLEDWSRGAHPVRVREGLLLQCPDAESASTLERLAKGDADRVGEASLFLTDRKTLAGLRRKAAESGIFL